MVTISFYEALEKYYDDIFPLQQDTLLFLEEVFGGSHRKRIIDLACGTGSYTLALAGKGFQLAGLDLDDTMIRLAQQKKELHAAGAGGEVSFLRGDMRTLSTLLQPGYDGAFCIGNSLVHIQTAAEIAAVIKEIAAVLRDGAVLVIQTVNYDRILRNAIKSLPTLGNKERGISFERLYSYDRGQHKILFTGVLHLPDATSRTNTIPLYPLQKDELEEMLGKAGFARRQFYGDFSGAPWSADTPATISAASF